MNNTKKFDVIVVGGGHAGTEAALAAARRGASTLLLTHSIDTLGAMSCNPAIGGIGKGHLVKEIDALGGLMARGADACGIHFRVLNASKGPAVRATRAQIDRVLYRNFVRSALESQENLVIFQQAVDDLIVEANTITGVITQMGLKFYAPAVILTVGTFLGGRIHVGETNYAAGRAGDPPSIALAERLRALPFRVDRLKTGTPPRIAANSVDFSVLDEQAGDKPVPVFSFMGNAAEHPEQVSCHITRTSAKTHDIIRAGLDRSPMYSGEIEGTGPRYCPSIEDKVVRFADRDSHQIFVEPEGLTSNEIYPNGISTSLPYEVQIELVHSIKGFENAHITRPGYAIEYDYLDPRDLRPTLETRIIDGLFFAGQINGTTGYEEAAAQGLLAGINAVNKVRGEEGWCPGRDEAYIGVMVDDLVTRGTAEPYRMFTSRAEYRLQLREDNADLRLTEKGHALGLVDANRWQQFESRRTAVNAELKRLASTWLRPDDVSDADAERVLGAPLRHEYALDDLLRRPGVSYASLMSLPGTGPAQTGAIARQVEVQIRYAGYIERQSAEVERNRGKEQTKLPDDLDYADVHGLSSEVCEKLTAIRPASVGQATRIPGITPVAISLLLIHLKKRSAA